LDDNQQWAAHFATAGLSEDGTEVDRVFIRDLVLSCSIGVYPKERLATQRVRFNVDLHVRRTAAPLDDDIANVVSYDDVVMRIKELISAGHINLVETLAERVADSCLADPRITKVRVKVEKLDVAREAASVGVEIERRAPAHPPAEYYVRPARPIRVVEPLPKTSKS